MPSGRCSQWGRIAITGTLGYGLAYVHQIRTPTGRTIWIRDKPPDQVR